MKAFVLGSGPAGLVAAHAAALKGYEVEILTDKMSPSIISGAQYLDKPIPGITEMEPDSHVTFMKWGKAKGYAKKIYGDPKAPTSWEKYGNDAIYPVWYLRDAYSTLWERYKSKLTYMKMDADVMERLYSSDVDMIVIAMPLNALCYRPEHTFYSQRVTIYAGLPSELGNSKYEALLSRKDTGNWILYCGKKSIPWYRCSEINGGASVEVPEHYVDGHQIIKPLRTDCDCWTDKPRVVPVGRYGTWQKNELVSGAWERVLDSVYALQ
jgi:hypothetical protein